MNRYTINDSTSYSLGMSLTIEAILHKPEYVEKVIISQKANKNEQLSYLLKLCDDNNISVDFDEKTIEKLSIKENCYCIGVFKKFNTSLASNNHIVLYKFDDFGELGTILRSAVSFNFKDIVLIDSDIDYFDPRCIRASMGSIFHTNIVRFNSFDEYLKAYNKQNIIPFVSNGNRELKQLKIKDSYSIVIPQNYYDLNDLFKDGYYIEHNNLDAISLSVRSSIILSHLYYLNLNR